MNLRRRRHGAEKQRGKESETAPNDEDNSVFFVCLSRSSEEKSHSFQLTHALFQMEQAKMSRRFLTVTGYFAMRKQHDSLILILYFCVNTSKFTIVISNLEENILWQDPCKMIELTRKVGLNFDLLWIFMKDSKTLSLRSNISVVDFDHRGKENQNAKVFESKKCTWRL